jgi:hypothetical protein
LKKLVLGLGGATAIGLLMVTSAMAASFTLFGNAEIVPGGNPGNAAQLSSVATEAEPFGGVDFAITPTDWVDLETLSTDYNVTDDDCGGGSPRIVLGIDTDDDGDRDGFVIVHPVPSPNFTDCAVGWQSSPNLIGNEEAGRYDYSGFGGSNFSTYSQAPDDVTGATIVEAFIVVDSSWSAAATGGDGEMTTLIDNFNFNGDITTFGPDEPTEKDACKTGGWQDLERADGTAFKNQGDCIQYFNTGN